MPCVTHHDACPCRESWFADERNKLRAIIYRQHMRLIEAAGPNPSALVLDVLAEAKAVLDEWGTATPAEDTET